MVHSICQRNLTETEEKTIAHFRYYYDSKRSFALIGDHVVVGLSEENAGDLEKLKQEAGENMSQMLQYPPDFTTYVMDDMFGLVSMDYGVYGVSPEILSKEELESGHMNIGTALAVRSLCLDACEKGEIIAINDEGKEG